MKIWHNPKCGTSRNTLNALKAGGYEVEVMEYLKTPPSYETLASVLDMLGMTASELMRERGASDEAISAFQAASDEKGRIAALHAYPALIERPVVINDDKAVLCRPKEEVLNIAPDARFEAS